MGKVIVVLDTPEETTDSGIFIPETARKSSTEAVVVASGHPDLTTGDKVLLAGEYVGASFTLSGVEYITVLVEEILVKVD